jgi:hypothetical protein
MTTGEIVPGIFKCREHDVVLTQAVVAKVEATPVTAAGAGWRIGDRRAPRKFKVVVHCGGGEGHDLVFHGTYRKV